MIARKSLLIVSTQIVIKFLGWIGLIVLAKLWGGYAPEALGSIAFAMSFLALFFAFSGAGFPQAHIKRISEGKDLGTCIGTYASIKIILTLFMILLVFASILIFNINFDDSTSSIVIVILLFYYVFKSLSKIPITTFQATKEIAKSQLASIFENSVKIPVMILIAFFTFSIGLLAVSYVSGAFAVFLIGMWLLRKYPIKRPSLELCKSYCLFAIPIFLVSMMSDISVNIDKIMIGYFWTSVEVGYYFTVQQISSLVLVLPAAISILLFPTFSELHTMNHLEKIRDILHLSVRYISMVAIPFVVMIVAFSVPFIRILLSSAFLPATTVLVMLSIVAFISALSAPYVSLISGINKPFFLAVIGIIVCTLNIVLNYFFIQENGMLSSFNISGPLGASYATFISALIGLISFSIVSRNTIGTKIIHLCILKHIFAGSISYILLIFLSGFVVVFHWYHLFMFFALNIILYVSILYVIKEFTKKDFNFFVDLIHPRKMINYITSEIKR